MKTSQLLIEVRKLLARPLGWTKRTFTSVNLDKGGRKHVCFCMLGALQEVERPSHKRIGLEARRLIRDQLPEKYECNIAQFNDDPATTRKDILGLLDQVIVVSRKAERAASRTAK